VFAVLRRRLETAWGEAGVRHFIQVLRLLDEVSLGELTAAVEQALAIGATTADAVRVLLEVTREATYAYDAVSRLTDVYDRNERHRAFRYDAADRMVGQTWYTETGAVQDVLTFAYDAVGNQTRAENGAGAYVLTYDEQGRAETVANPFELSLTFSYDAAGNRTKVEDSRGGVLTSVYDKANRLESRRFSDGVSQLRFDYGYTERDQVKTYGYDLAGNRNTAGYATDTGPAYVKLKIDMSELSENPVEMVRKPPKM
jgi:YD repeat-containing protein